VTDWKAAAAALLGSWPSLVASWGREAIQAYVVELEARGVTPDQALEAIRTTDATFPPSAGEIAQLARRDPAEPTFAEACTLIFGRGGVLRARTGIRKASWEEGERDRLNDEAAWQCAGRMHPLIGAFVRSQGLDRLKRLNLDDPEYGGARRKQLADDWEAFAEAHETRDIAALLAGRRGELARFDPLRALSGPRLLEKRAS
jgi:hypothetical protein